MAEILLIEDNPGDIILTKEAFKECSHSHNITAFSDGIEAMKYLRKEDKYINAGVPDLILLDLNLPKKDGRELLAEIKSDSALRIIPIIVLSTSKNERDIMTSYELKANCYICKPVELESFIDIILEIEKFWFKTVRLPDYQKFI
jgi:two-component system, chemotaxis family, response regulator Rcp1